MLGYILGGLAAGAVGYFTGERANQQAQQNSAAQIAFQEQMSNTAHQREIRDLEAAGLNPILSGKGGSGASTPTGSAAPVINSGSSALSAVSTALAIRRQQADLKLIDAQTANTNWNTELVSTQRSLLENQIMKPVYETATAKAIMEGTQADLVGRQVEADIDQTAYGKFLRAMDRAAGLVRGGNDTVRTNRK